MKINELTEDLKFKDWMDRQDEGRINMFLTSATEWHLLRWERGEWTDLSEIMQF